MIENVDSEVVRLGLVWLFTTAWFREGQPDLDNSPETNLVEATLGRWPDLQPRLDLPVRMSGATFGCYSARFLVRNAVGCLLTWRAQGTQVQPASLIAWYAQYCIDTWPANEIDVSFAILLTGLPVDAEISLADGVRLRPFTFLDVAIWNQVVPTSSHPSLCALGVLESVVRTAVVFGDVAAEQVVDISSRLEQAVGLLQVASAVPVIPVVAWCSTRHSLLVHDTSHGNLRNAPRFWLPEHDYDKSNPTLLQQRYALLSGSHEIVQHACQRFGLGLERTTPHDRVMDVVIALESVLTAPVRDDLKFRMALIGSWLASGPPDELERSFDILKAAYNVRSAVVHEAQPKKNSDPSAVAEKLVPVARAILLACAERVPQSLSKTGREEFWHRELLHALTTSRST